MGRPDHAGTAYERAARYSKWVDQHVSAEDVLELDGRRRACPACGGDLVAALRYVRCLDCSQSWSPVFFWAARTRLQPGQAARDLAAKAGLAAQAAHELGELPPPGLASYEEHWRAVTGEDLL